MPKIQGLKVIGKDHGRSGGFVNKIERPVELRLLMVPSRFSEGAHRTLYAPPHTCIIDHAMCGLQLKLNWFRESYFLIGTELLAQRCTAVGLFKERHL